TRVIPLFDRRANMLAKGQPFQGVTVSVIRRVAAVRMTLQDRHLWFVCSIRVFKVREIIFRKRSSSPIRPANPNVGVFFHKFEEFFYKSEAVLVRCGAAVAQED